MTLSRDDQAGFRLAVVNGGKGVTADELRSLTAIRRFRGDEGRNRRPGAPGLGLAVAREVADRFHLQLDLRRPDAGGFEAEFSRKTTSLGRLTAYESPSALRLSLSRLALSPRPSRTPSKISSA